jgi:hypothetical protein
VGANEPPQVFKRQINKIYYLEEKKMGKAILKCSCCECELAWTIQGEEYGICSSAYVEGFSMCHECLVEHCISTNCLGCRLGVYPDCSFSGIKEYYMEYKED